MYMITQSFELLKPGGIFFAEDFFELGHLTETEKETLKRDVFCSYLPDMETYKTQLRSAGFEILEVPSCNGHNPHFIVPP